MSNKKVYGGKLDETEQFKEYYKNEKVMKTYDKQREANKYRKEKRKRELSIFLKLLDKKEGEKVLELGCSSGFLTQHLGNVIAIDTSSEMLKLSKQKNPSATVLEADMFKLPFEVNSFDKIVTMRVWNHLNEKDLRLSLRESKRVLKKGGFLIFDMEEKNWLRRFVGFFYKRIYRISGFKIYQYSTEEMAILLKEEGFTKGYYEELNHRVGRQIIWKVKNI